MTTQEIVKTLESIKNLAKHHIAETDSNDWREVYGLACAAYNQLTNSKVHALFVANYIIEYADKKGYEIRNLLLQDMLYFVHVRCLLEYNDDIYQEPLKKFKYGVRDEKTYNEYKHYGAFPIKSENIVDQIISCIDMTARPMKLDFEYYNPDIIPYKNLIEDTVDALHYYIGLDLAEIIQSHDPYKYNTYDIINNNQAIINYYQTHKDAQIWNN